MPNKLRVGVVGCGFIAQRVHIPSFVRLKENVAVQAVCDKNENLARETAKRYGIPKAYSDLDEMLSKEPLDIVDVCTPPEIHASLALKAIAYGCHILLEKPMALRTADCDEMIDAAQKQGVKICVAHNDLFQPPFIKAKKLVAEGAVGDFIGMRILLSDPRDDVVLRKDYWVHELPGGLVSEVAPHAVFMSLPFLNKVKSVDIYAKNFLEHPWAPFDEFRIELEGEKAVSSIVISSASNRRSLDIDILGTEGILYLDLQSMLLIHKGGKELTKLTDHARYQLDTTSQILRWVAANALKMMTTKVKSGHATLIEMFVKSILDGAQPPVTGEEGRESTRVMEMIVEKLYQKYGDCYGNKAERIEGI